MIGFVILGIVALIVIMTTGNPRPFRVTRGITNCDATKRFIERHGDVKVKAGMYPLQKSDGLGSYRDDEFVDTTLGDLLSSGTTPALQYKFIPDDESNELARHLRSQGYGKFSTRVCSAPWRFDSHFDCHENALRIVYGSKVITLFYMTGKSHLEQRDILKDLANRGTSDLVKTLQDKYEIHADTVRLRAGDEIFIPTGMYHFVEADEPSIGINTKMYEATAPGSVCSTAFTTIWPKQKQICKDNKCLY